MIRIASKALVPEENGYEYAKEKGEVVLRHKEDAATYICAKFLEDNRALTVLTIQKFMVSTSMPYGSGFSFVGSEIEKLLEFINNIRTAAFPSSSALNITDEELRKIALTNSQAQNLVAENEALFAALVRSEVTKEDVVALGYRKKQLAVFDQLLNDEGYFEKIRLKQKTKITAEGLWQRFFEKNPWIFGYGLSYINLSALDDKKLEQVVAGHSISSHGKRSDALMKTRGLISSLCFVEIKTHATSLLESSAYRVGCWPPSKELGGAIAQVQGTVASAVRDIREKLVPSDKNGNPSGEELFNFQPKSFLVVGSLSEFQTEHGVNEDKYRSFELLRKNTQNPEVITFDELYERAKFIVSSNES